MASCKTVRDLPLLLLSGKSMLIRVFACLSIHVLLFSLLTSPFPQLVRPDVTSSEADFAAGFFSLKESFLLPILARSYSDCWIVPLHFVK